MSATPVTFTVEWEEPRSRLTTFFRWLLAIPHFIVAFFWGIAAFCAVIVAWFALVFTGRWPRGLYDFVTGYLRYTAFINGYAYLLTDRFPPFTGDDPTYPVQLGIGPPKDEYSRAKAFFRIVLYIPVYVIAYALAIVASVGVVLAWFAIVILGRQVRPLQEMIVLGLSYQLRATAYTCLVTEDWPPFTSPGSELTAGSGGTLGPGGGGFAPPQAPSARAAGGETSPADPPA